MQLSIIIVSFNTSQLTTQTLVSILQEFAHDSRLADNSEIIVVDNNSQDNSVASIKKTLATHPHHQIIVNEENVGFAKANNQGISASSGEYILLLNSDTVIQPQALQRLLAQWATHPLSETTANLRSAEGSLDKLGILAPLLKNPDGSWQPQGGSFPTLLSLFFHMTMLDDLPVVGRFLPSTQHTGYRALSPSFSQPEDSSTAGRQLPLQKMDWVGGTAMMLRREVIADIGLLDEQIFMYGEDVEYCLRASHHHWDCAIDPNASIVHYGSASSTSSNAILGEIRGYLYIWSKHKPLWQSTIVLALLKLGCVLRIILFGTMLKDSQRAAVYSQALRELS